MDSNTFQGLLNVLITGNENRVNNLTNNFDDLTSKMTDLEEKPNKLKDDDDDDEENSSIGSNDDVNNYLNSYIN